MSRNADPGDIYKLIQKNDITCIICRRRHHDVLFAFAPESNTIPDGMETCTIATVLPCNHTFGLSCIQKWERESRVHKQWRDRGLPWKPPRGSCPVCRSPLPLPQELAKASGELLTLRNAFELWNDRDTNNHYIEPIFMDSAAVKASSLHVQGLYKTRFCYDNNSVDINSAVFASDICRHLVENYLPRWIDEYCLDLARRQGKETGTISALKLPMAFSCWASLEEAAGTMGKPGERVKPDQKDMSELYLFLKMVAGKLIWDILARKRRVPDTEAPTPSREGC